MSCSCGVAHCLCISEKASSLLLETPTLGIITTVSCSVTMAILRKKHRNSTHANFHLWRPRSWWRQREDAALAPPGLSLPAGQALRLPPWGRSCLLTMAVGLAQAGRVVLESQGVPRGSVGPAGQLMVHRHISGPHVWTWSGTKGPSRYPNSHWWT